MGHNYKKIKSERRKAFYKRKMTLAYSNESKIDILLNYIVFRRSHIIEMLKRLKLNISYSQLKKELEGIQYDEFDSIHNYGEKKRKAKRVINVLQRDWNLNEVIDDTEKK